MTSPFAEYPKRLNEIAIIKDAFMNTQKDLNDTQYALSVFKEKYNKMKKEYDELKLENKMLHEENNSMADEIHKLKNIKK